MQCRRRFASVLSIACCALALAVVCAKPGRAQDPLTAFPKNYSRLFSNEAVDVIRVHYGPHGRVGVHDHSELPTVYVYLSDSGPVRFQHDEVPPFTLVRKPVEKGSYRVSPGRLERHTVENLGDESSDFLRVELKQVPLGTGQEFREQAPASLAANADTVEYRAPALSIERVVCTGPAACPVKASPQASLLILFEAAAELHQGGSHPSQSAPGTVQWLPAGQRLAIAPVQGTSAHLLRLLLPGPAQ